MERKDYSGRGGQSWSYVSRTPSHPSVIPDGIAELSGGRSFGAPLAEVPVLLQERLRERGTCGILVPKGLKHLHPGQIPLLS